MDSQARNVNSIDQLFLEFQQKIKQAIETESAKKYEKII